LVLLVQFSGLDDRLLDQVPHNPQRGHAHAHQVVLVIDLLDLSVGARQRALDLLDGFRVGRIALLDLIERDLQLGLRLVKDLVLGIELREVVEDLVEVFDTADRISPTSASVFEA
jgi:hypothetical protein